MNEIDKFREIYISCPQPDNLERWDQIETKLGKQDSSRPYIPSSLITAVVGIFLFSATLVGVAQAAKPGDHLYPLKILTDNTIAAVARNPELKVQKRAEDIIKVSSDSGRLEDAIKHYQQTVNDAKKEVQEKSQDQQKLKQTLKDQDKKFTEEAKKEPAFSSKLPEIINEDKKIEGEIKKDQQKKGQSKKE
ncbi:MAG: hypothetical protein M1142_04615 [Patescibacteria group bacterium]|nr:hypothetical protein [Patescibacteria group bacterium]